MRNTNKASRQRAEPSCQRAAAAVGLRPACCAGAPCSVRGGGRIEPPTLPRCGPQRFSSKVKARQGRGAWCSAEQSRRQFGGDSPLEGAENLWGHGWWLARSSRLSMQHVGCSWKKKFPLWGTFVRIDPKILSLWKKRCFSSKRGSLVETRGGNWSVPPTLGHVGMVLPELFAASVGRCQSGH